MVRIARIVADDGDVCIEIAIKIKRSGTLTKGETEVVRSGLLRSIGRAIEGVRYTDFGIDNIKIVIGG